MLVKLCKMSFPVACRSNSARASCCCSSGPICTAAHVHEAHAHLAAEHGSALRAAAKESTRAGHHSLTRLCQDATRLDSWVVWAVAVALATRLSMCVRQASS